jgi:lipopolysaccharide transport system permease protein
MRTGHQLIESRDSRPTRDSRSEQASRAGLAGNRSLKTALIEILSDSWHYRELLYQFTLRDIRIRYKQAVMGFAWALFIPILVVLAGLVVRYVMAYLTGSHLQAKAVLAMSLKAMPWSFFVGALGFATTSLTSNMALITKVYFPREVMPLSATLAQGFDSLIGGAGLLPVLLLLGLRWSASWLWWCRLQPLQHSS